MVDTIYVEHEIIGTKKAQEIISKFRHAKVTSIKRFGEVFNPVSYTHLTLPTMIRV